MMGTNRKTLLLSEILPTPPPAVTHHADRYQQRGMHPAETRHGQKRSAQQGTPHGTVQGGSVARCSMFSMISAMFEGTFNCYSVAPAAERAF